MARRRRKDEESTISKHRPDRVARGLSIFAIAISFFGAWFNYASSLPAISAKIELLEPITPGQPIRLKVDLDNIGKTSANGLQPQLAFLFAKKDSPFEPKYDAENVPPDWVPTTSDLGPGGHTTLYSTNEKALAHEHDISTVLSGQWNFYVYGRLPFRDILFISREAHFCGIYQPATRPTADSLKFNHCPSYNETN